MTKLDDSLIAIVIMLQSAKPQLNLLLSPVSHLDQCDISHNK